MPRLPWPGRRARVQHRKTRKTHRAEAVTDGYQRLPCSGMEARAATPQVKAARLPWAWGAPVRATFTVPIGAGHRRQNAHQGRGLVAAANSSRSARNSSA